MSESNGNGTEDTWSDSCPDFAWLCKKLAQQIMDISRDSNVSDGVTKFLNNGKYFILDTIPSQLPSMRSIRFFSQKFFFNEIDALILLTPWLKSNDILPFQINASITPNSNPQINEFKKVLFCFYDFTNFVLKKQ